MVAVGCNTGEGGGGRGGSRCQWRCKVACDRSELWVGDGGAMSMSGSCGSGMGLNHGGFECFLERLSCLLVRVCDGVTVVAA
ncbi:hypothetical protein FCV25MIE_25246 [Fagus crenata]